MKITFLDCATLGDDLNLDMFNEMGEIALYKSTPHECIAERIEDTDVVVVNKIKLNNSNLPFAKKLKLICVAATGYDNIDIDYCKKNNIAVANVPGYSTDSVAQLTLTMALNLVMHLGEYNDFVSSGEYTKSGVANRLVPVWHELNSMTWGVVGGGNIGQRVASLAKSFGCRVLMCRQKQDPEYQTVDIDYLCENADIISLHTPLTDKTCNLINRERILKMKKSAILINVARGAVADEEALVQAIEQGSIGGLGIDVYSSEPILDSHPYYRILDRDNVCFTPHIAWGSYESRCRCIKEILDNIKAFYFDTTRNRIV